MVHTKNTPTEVVFNASCRMQAHMCRLYIYKSNVGVSTACKTFLQQLKEKSALSVLQVTLEKTSLDTECLGTVCYATISIAMSVGPAWQGVSYTVTTGAN